MELRNISYSYPDNKEVLKDINISIEEGKITGIIGKTGCGKSTLLDIISNLIKPDKGEVINDKKIGYVIQNNKASFFCKTVKEELELSAVANNYRVNELEKRVKAVLKIVNLDESILLKNPLLLSNNESKKLSLAIILMYNPKIIILDEPTTNLDNNTVLEMMALLKKLKHRYSKTIIVVSHDVDMLHKLVDNIIAMDNGQIILAGNKYDVFKNVKLLKKHGIVSPKTMIFSDTVLTKHNVKIGYRDEINDLIKDIFRNV